MFKSLSVADKDFLQSFFSYEEIRRAVWDCGGDRAPGPDGFNFTFIKTFWSTVKDDFIKAIKHFEVFGTLARGCNSSFITLVPKLKDPINLSDFRPISLIGCLYKVIAKLLANRLKLVIGSVIGEAQTDFIKGRNILEGPLIINEVCNWVKKVKTKALIFKVDFHKAFDSVNWEYLDSVMLQMGFGDIWRKWIRGCISSAWASVLVNGSPTKEFHLSRGIRQGDPLSPFLFIIAMEGLNVALKSAGEINIFKGIKIPNGGPIISHMFYADDAIFVGDWDRSNLKNLARILRCFHVASGLKVNFHKSKVYGIGFDSREVNRWANVLGCEPSSLPFMYLGVPVGENMNLIKP